MSMTISKAVEILDQYLKQGCIMSTQDLHDSIALSIEALKRLRERRTGFSLAPHVLLIGETEEVSDEP